MLFSLFTLLAKLCYCFQTFFADTLTVPMNCSIPVCLLLFECPHLRSIAACDGHAHCRGGTKCVANTLRHSRIVLSEQQVPTICEAPGNRQHDSQYDAHNPIAA
jgi:hypothetical protein